METSKRASTAGALSCWRSELEFISLMPVSNTPTAGTSGNTISTIVWNIVRRFKVFDILLCQKWLPASTNRFYDSSVVQVTYETTPKTRCYDISVWIIRMCTISGFNCPARTKAGTAHTSVHTPWISTHARVCLNQTESQSKHFSYHDKLLHCRALQTFLSCGFNFGSSKKVRSW